MEKDLMPTEKFAEIIAGDIQKSIPEKLKEMPNEKLIQSFFEMKKYPEETQKAVLQDILKRAEKSEFGRKYGFEDIKSLEAFKQKVPLSDYDDYQPYLERLKAAQADLLFDGKTASFIATSGSTGIPKLIPESKNGELVKALVSQIRAMLMLMMAPEVMAPGKEILAIANPSEYAKTEGDIPVGSASGQAAKDLPPELLQKLVLPAALLLAKDLDNEATDYLTIRFALAQKNLAGVVCSNIAHFNILLKKMNAAAAALINDIRTGGISATICLNDDLRAKLSAGLKPDPERAEELEKILETNGSLTVAAIWPDFSVVSCWMSSTAQRIVNDVKKRLPAQVKFLEWGYGASEGKFNIPDQAGDPAGLLALFGYFFEFRPIGKVETLQAYELSVGEHYELIVTSYSGLYRYNMKDIVYVEEMIGRSPRIVFVSKASEKLQIADFEMAVYEIDAALQQASDQLGEEIRFYQVLADQKKQRMVFIVEPFSVEMDEVALQQALENSLSAVSREYQQKRKDGQLLPLQVLLMKDGYRDSLFTRSIMPGKNVNQTKLKTIVTEFPDHNFMINGPGGKQ